MHDRSIADRFRRALLTAALLTLPLGSALGAPAAAQAPATASQITGTVLDAAGKALGKARVAVTGPANQSVESGPDGRFSFTVPPGIYTITVQAPGFEQATNESVVLMAGQTATLSFTLASATLQTIGRTSTSSSSTRINTTAAAVDTISNATIVSQGQTQVLNVLDQTPGVEINRSTSNEPGGNSSISIRGAQPYESQVLIDGHPVVTSANGAFGFNSTFINSLLLSNIDVSKGPGSYPNTIEDAVGGSLNFRTPNITATPSFSALVGYDTFNGSSFGVRFSDTFGKIGILVGAAGYSTPGYLTPGLLYGGNNSSAQGFPIYPNPQLAGNYGPNAPGYVGVVNFAYPATSNFGSNSQLVKLAYNFSPVTSVTFGTYATQTNLDETGNNDQSIYARIVSCINNTKGAPSPLVCPPLTGIPNYNINYTSNPNLNLVGSVQPINFYAAYPNTTEFDNEPIYTGEFRTVIGPGSLLARYYTATITRTVTQESYPAAVGPCYSPACPFDPNSPGDTNGYPGEPYIEPTIDELHGVDAQYLVALGADNLTFGFDRHVDNAAFAEDYDYTTGVPAGFAFIPIQSISYSVRGDFPIQDRLDLSAGGYLSSTSFVGTRLDPRASITYKLTRNAIVRASAGSAFVAPYYGLINPTPYVSDSVLYEPTQNFKPETSMGYDIGTDVKLGRDDLISFDTYLTNIFNRYAEVTVAGSGTLGKKTYSSIEQNGNQANVRNEGIEFAYKHLPRVGIGFDTAVDLLRDYAYDQSPTASDDNIFIGGVPANGVQLPEYPYSKIRNDLSYTFKSQAQVRLSSTTYGENNPFGEPAFTYFDGAIRMPVAYGAFINLGVTNMFGRDDSQAGGIYNGGPTYPTVGGSIGPTGLYFVQPRTIFIQLSRTVGATR